jgi:hypothetical protein
VTLTRPSLDQVSRPQPAAEPHVAAGLRPRERNAAEVDSLAEAMPDHLRVAVFLAAWCQLRRGELLGLRRRDLDLEQGTVSASVTRTRPMAGAMVQKAQRPKRRSKSEDTISASEVALGVEGGALTETAGPGPNAEWRQVGEREWEYLGADGHWHPAAPAEGRPPPPLPLPPPPRQVTTVRSAHQATALKGAPPPPGSPPPPDVTPPGSHQPPPPSQSPAVPQGPPAIVTPAGDQLDSSTPQTDRPGATMEPVRPPNSGFASMTATTPWGNLSLGTLYPVMRGNDLRTRANLSVTAHGIRWSGPRTQELNFPWSSLRKIEIGEVAQRKGNQRSAFGFGLVGLAFVGATAIHNARARQTVAFRAIRITSDSGAQFDFITPRPIAEVGNLLSPIAAGLDARSEAPDLEPPGTSHVEAPAQIGIADELTKLSDLCDAGVLSQEEFAAQKRRLLGG